MHSEVWLLTNRDHKVKIGDPNIQTDNKKFRLKNVVYTFLINRNGSVFTAGATVCYARNIYIFILIQLNIEFMSVNIYNYFHSKLFYSLYYLFISRKKEFT